MGRFRTVAVAAMILSTGCPTAFAYAKPPMPATAVVDDDIGRFWKAFDAIIATSDPAERLRLIQTLYIDPARPDSTH